MIEPIVVKRKNDFYIDNAPGLPFFVLKKEPTFFQKENRDGDNRGSSVAILVQNGNPQLYPSTEGACVYMYTYMHRD